MVNGGGGFSNHHHNKAVAMRIFNGGRFEHLETLTKIGNIQNSGKKNGGFASSQRAADEEGLQHEDLNLVFMRT